MLGLHRKCQCLLLTRILALPQALEEVEAELSAECVLDHRAVALARPRPRTLTARRTSSSTVRVVLTLAISASYHQGAKMHALGASAATPSNPPGVDYVST